MSSEYNYTNHEIQITLQSTYRINKSRLSAWCRSLIYLHRYNAVNMADICASTPFSGSFLMVWDTSSSSLVSSVNDSLVPYMVLLITSMYLSTFSMPVINESTINTEPDSIIVKATEECISGVSNRIFCGIR
eukprot:670287_1